MTNRFELLPTTISELFVLNRKLIGDDRGYLDRLFCVSDLQALIGGNNIVQINHTLTVKRGTVRGMHFQHPPHSEVKIVSCLCGEVFDVAVDIRRNSPTFLKWHGEILSANNHKTLFIPEGFAHGFQTLTENCELLYFHTAPYRADTEGGLNAKDANLAIEWPLPITEISPRDLAHPFLTPDFIGEV